MATVVPYRRPRRGPPPRLPAPRWRGQRRSPVAWLGRYFGLFALAAMAMFLLRDGGIDRQFAESRQAAPRTSASSTLAGYPAVVDGDTLRLNGARIRIVGIDAPEKDQTCTDAGGQPWACGRVATQWLSALIGGRPVACTATGRDRYGRTLATCAAGEAGEAGDLGAAMVRDGYAVGYFGGYADLEELARRQQSGLWAGRFERPQDWRRLHRR